MDSDNQHDATLDNVPEDNESIDVISESGHSLADMEWSTSSASRGSIAGSDVDGMDFQKLSIHSKMARLVHHDGRQFIEQRDLADGGLPYSAELYLNDEVWKLNGEDCLLMSHRRYIAKVKVEGRIDMEEATNFEEAALNLLKHVKVVKVLLDEQLEECINAKGALQLILDKLVVEPERITEHKRDILLLRILLQKHGNALNESFMQELKNYSDLSSKTMAALGNYVTKTIKLIQRNEILGHLNDPSISEAFIGDAIQKTLRIHRAQLVAICPTVFIEGLKKIPDDTILYYSSDDINLFADLITLNGAFLESALPVIFTKLTAKVQEIDDRQPVDQGPLSSKVFLYICKSLTEVVEQLGVHTASDSVINYSEAHGWEVPNVQEEFRTPNSKHLKKQLQMIAALANHFEPGGPFRTSHFPYEFKLFQNMDAIPEPVRIWLCLLDDCMKDMVHAEVDKLQMLSCFFGCFVSFVASKEFDCETLECLRKITQDALQSMADMQGTCEQNFTFSDPILLECNDMIDRCFSTFLCEHFANDCERIQATLRRIIDQNTKRNAPEEELTEFCQEFKQLLKDLGDLPLDWYLWLPPSENKNLLLRGQFIVPVDNHWRNTECECLKVVDRDGFVKMYKLMNGGDEIPEHYQLKVIQMLLEKLATGIHYPHGHRLVTTISMVNAARNAFLYLSKQPDYPCFELYQKTISELFNHASEEDRSLETIASTRSCKLIDSEPSFSKNSTSESRYERYLTQFNFYLSTTMQLPRTKRIEQIVSDIRAKVVILPTGRTGPSVEIELPTLILAGLSAVWYLIDPKVSSNSKISRKLSRVHVDCVLEFFVNENDPDVDMNRLLYLSSQQGKDLVMGLTAAILALRGYRVLIVCYNSSLARSRAVSMIELFEEFSVQNLIEFASIEDMARESSRMLFNKCVGTVYKNLGLDFENSAQGEHTQHDNTVLLIDDVDLLFQNKILGQSFQRLIAPTIPGLALVQEKLFCQEAPLTEIDKFIKNSKDPEMFKLKTFLSRKQTYKLLEITPSRCEERSYTNKTLFDIHVTKSDNNKNCGIFTLGYIPFPYANLLNKYRFVFVFSSDFKEDGRFAEEALQEHYGIAHITDKWDSLKNRPVKFDPIKDFHYINGTNQWDWMISVMVSIIDAVDRKCSVLVFFRNGQTMKAFQKKFTSQLQHLIVKAIHTASNKMMDHTDHSTTVDEVTVLMISRREDLAEDRNIHVIQTFPSEYGVEENIIRRQAERSHGSGSYQLIVSSSDLPVTCKSNNDVTYVQLVLSKQVTLLDEATASLDKNLELYLSVQQFYERQPSW